MESLRRLLAAVLVSGLIGGLLLFVVQHFTTYPLIEKAEGYEAAAKQKMPSMDHDDEGWQPSNGIERDLFTAVTTVLVAIGFAALLFGTAAIVPIYLDWRKGTLWGLVAFICVDLAPAWGLPPQPPGVPVADLYARQLWWIATVVATSVALWLLLDRRRAGSIRLIGLLVLVVPHIVGAPVASGESSLPSELIHRFELLSILTTGMFWVVLGSVGGFFYQRFGYMEAQ